jgi:hypothetical protein
MSQRIHERPFRADGNDHWRQFVLLDGSGGRGSEREVHNAHAYAGRAPKPCGHIRHVGTCAPCQRAQLTRWRAQLTQVQGVLAVAH